MVCAICPAWIADQKFTALLMKSSTQVALLRCPALVTHEEVKIWAEAEEIEEKTQDLDDWEIAQRKAARKAKIVAVPLG